jgi:hypothetical protein
LVYPPFPIKIPNSRQIPEDSFLLSQQPHFQGQTKRIIPLSSPVEKRRSVRKNRRVCLRKITTSYIIEKVCVEG